MSKSAGIARVAFLFDVSTCRESKDNWKEAISLCIFRILCFLSSRHKTLKRKGDKRKRLKWGYKLFDIDGQSGVSRSVSSGFKDFKSKTFDEFETDFMNVEIPNNGNDANPASQSQNPSSQPQQTQRQLHRSASKKAQESSNFPAKSLSNCLTESLQDFSWEDLEIGSPVKKRRSHEEEASKDKPKSNFVFLLSRVPCDKKTMRYYCNKVVIDKGVFLESFMPELLQQELLVRRSIKISWIDTGRYLQPNITEKISPDQKYYELVEQCAKAMGGALVPFHGLVTHLSTSVSRRHFAEVSQDAENESTKDAVFKVPHATQDDASVLLASFACMSTCSAMLPCGRPAEDVDLGAAGSQEVPQSVVLVVGQQDGEKSTEISLKLVPLLQSANESTKSQKIGEEQTLQLTSVDSSEDACCLLRRRRKSGRQAAVRPVTSLESRATIEKWRLRQLRSGFSSSAVCSVVTNSPSEQHKAFSALLQSLQSQRKALILSLKSGNGPCLQLAVLEPASLHSAHLSYLSIGMTLQVEKLLGPPAHSMDKPQKRTSFQAFQDRTVGAILATQKSQPQQLCAQGDADSRSLGNRMWVNSTNPWHRSSSVNPQQQLLDKLSDRLEEMPFLSEEDKDTLLDMRQTVWLDPLYDQLNSQGTPTASPSSAGSPFPFPRTGSSERGNSRDSGSGSESRSSMLQHSLSRGQMMVSRSRLVVSSSLSQDEVDGDYLPPAGSAVSTPLLQLTSLDLKSEDELSQYLQEQYSGVVENALGMDTTVQTLVTVTQHFMTQQNHSSPQKSAAEFLKQKILKGCRELKVYYQNVTEEDVKTRLTEYKLQILLRMEIESVMSGVDPSGQDEAADQVVEYLRSLLFVMGAGEVPEFLSNVLLINYLATLPTMLVTIYEELQQPVPLELAAFDNSIASIAPSTFGPLSGSSSLGSLAPGSSQSGPPNSNQSAGDSQSQSKTRSKARSNPVLTAQGPKRQIVVNSKGSKKSSKNGTKKQAKPRSARKSPRKQVKHRDIPSDGKVKRDLFNAKSKKASSEEALPSTPKKQTGTHKKRGSSRKGSKTFVCETPRHKQRSRLAYRREQVVKHFSKKDPAAVQVIAESPEKEIANIKESPTVMKGPARRIVKQAFYSGKPEHDSRNLKRATETADSITENDPKHHRMLRAQSAGRLSEALLEKDDEDDDRPTALTPRRRQMRARFIKQFTQSRSPELPSTSKDSTTPVKASRTPVKGRKTPVKGRRTPVKSSRSPAEDLKTPPRATRTPLRYSERRSLADHDSHSLPAFSASAVARLDFSSPQKGLLSMPDDELPRTPPRPITRSVTSATKSDTGPAPRRGLVSKLDFSSCIAKSALSSMSSTTDVERELSTKESSESISTASGLGSAVGSSSSSAGAGLKVKLQPRNKKKVARRTPSLTQPIPSSPSKRLAAVSPGSRSKHSAVVESPSRSRSPKRRPPASVSTLAAGEPRTPPRGRPVSKLDFTSPPRHIDPAIFMCEDSVPGTPPKARRVSSLNVSFVGRRSGQVSPGKSRAGTSTNESLAKVVQQVTGHATSGQVTPIQNRPSTSKSPAKAATQTVEESSSSSLRKSLGLTTPKKRQRATARRESLAKGISPQQSSSSSSSSQQSSILDYVSPVRKLSSSSAIQPDQSQPLTPPRGGASFCSPLKTPSKSILKGSPYVGRSQSDGTPHKVTFGVDSRRRPSRSPSPAGDMSPAIDKWPRRKRRGSNGSKSPSSDSATEQSPKKQLRPSHVESAFKNRGVGSDSAFFTGEADGEVSFPLASRKRVLLESEHDVVSSPNKRHKSDSATGLSFNRPLSFSENAMDGSTFHAAQGLFLGSAADSDEDLFASPKPHVVDAVAEKASPQFKTKTQESGFQRTQSFAFEGSQGFDVASSGCVADSSNSGVPPSPTFCTSPMSRSRTKPKTETLGKTFSAATEDMKTYSGRGKRKRKREDTFQPGTVSSEAESDSHGSVVENEPSTSAGLSQIRSQILTPMRKGIEAAESQLTPYRLKGSQTTLNVSPNVTTKGLVELLNSPLLRKGGPSGKLVASEENSDHEQRRSKRIRTRSSKGK